MNTKEMSFMQAFPSLKLPEEVRDLFDYVTVSRLTMNQSKTRLHVYIYSNNWIRKKSIYEVEEAITDQVFGKVEMDVKIIERFHLSSQYTPKNFYRVYRTSMNQELSDVSPILYQIFLHTDITFHEDGLVYAKIPDSIIARERKEELLDYLEKVFCERAGFSYVRVDGEIVSSNVSELFQADDEKIRSKVSDVVRRNRTRREKKEEEPAQKLPNASEKKYRQQKSFIANDPDVILGKGIFEDPTPIGTLGEDPHEVVVRGEVFNVENHETRNGKIILTAALTDYTDSIRFKLWLLPEELAAYTEQISNGKCFLVKGMMDFDQFEKEIMIKTVYCIKKIGPFKNSRADHAPVKRVELHCHTKMSDMDAVSSAKDIIKQAKGWGMKALAITDHGVVQAFPEAHHASDEKDPDFKVIYGCEGYLVDDMVSLVKGPTDRNINEPVVVFQTVTTGPSAVSHDLVEISAQKIEKGNLTESFTTLINPGRPLPFSFTRETKINDEMLVKAPDMRSAMERFLAFAGDMTLVSFDAEAEAAFVEESVRRAGLSWETASGGEEDGDTGRERTIVDIPSCVRYLMPQVSRGTLEKLCKALKIHCANPLRAEDRAQAMAHAFIQLQDVMKKQKVATYEELNSKGMISEERIRNLPYYHIIFLAKNETGRRNLYTLVSESHLKYFKKRPRVPRSLLMKHRDGLIIGSACSAGELYQAILNEKPASEITKIVNFYDYLEIQPVGNNEYMVREHLRGINSYDELREINRKIVRLADDFGKPCVATCDVHFLNPEDAIYRTIIQSGHGFKDEGQPPLYLHTTEEMMEEFAYLGQKKAYEVVVENTNKIADMIEHISPIHPDKCPPVIENSDEELENMCYDTARKIYGEPIPEQVTSRLNKELTSIIKNGYAVMYIIAQRLVQKSREDGYLVGSRGSVGSSLVATMSNITEVNPLPPHYLCPECHFVDFDSEEVRAYGGRCGADMPDRNCPVCGSPLKKMGFDIPFETFLGFKGDKEPDIDLNFSGDEQGVAQAYTEVIFGKGQTFKAGTIGTVAEKTAYGLAKHYFEDKGVTKKNCELERLAQGCVGVRRTTGQHPGGVIVLPKGMNINWFTPVQHPANDMTSDIITTHFDYHSIDRNLLKLDILGHDDPTIIRMLEDLTGTNPLEVPLDDPGVLSLFSGTEALGVKPEDMGGIDLGVLGVPEFGTNFVMGMLRDTQPKTLSELIRISGLSHGTNVWLDNAQYFIKNGDCTLSTAICTRDDIMLNLIAWGVEPEHSFKIMEAVRKGKGLKPDQEKEMRDHGVPEWYIESCKRIKYMFPKAHAAAYVMNAFRIAYYKINYPLAYYAAMFSIRVTTFDYVIMAQGRDIMEHHAEEIEKKQDRSPKEEEMLKDMLIVREMYARGYEFHRLDLYKAKATKFTILDGKLMPSFNSIAGLGDSAAESIEEAAKKGPFLSKDDFRQRTKVSQTIIDLFDEYGILGDIPESNQISLFDML